MSASPKGKRWWLWLPLLALAFWLAVFADKTPSGGAAPAAPTLVPPRAAAGVAKVLIPPSAIEQPFDRATLILERKRGRATGVDLFASVNWSPPAPIQMAAPAPPPTAPPLPFTFIGKKLEAGAWEVFLAKGEQSYVVRVGSVIDNSYRVEQIAPPNLSLTYLPLAQNQSLPIGASE